MSLGHSRGHSADPGFGDKLDVDSGLRIGALEVVNQLSDVLN